MAFTKHRGGECEELIRCVACDEYIESADGFYCPRCKKGPLCRRHRLAGKRDCLSCVIDLQMREMKILKQQEKNIRVFLRFTQFLFLVFSVFFIAIKFNILEDVSFLPFQLNAADLLYFGTGSVVIYLIFFLVLLNQRRRVRSIEAKIGEIEVRR